MSSQTGPAIAGLAGPTPTALYSHDNIMELLQIVPVFNFIILILHHLIDNPVSCTVKVITQMTQAIS